MTAFRIAAFNLYRQKEEFLRIGHHSILTISDIAGNIQNLQISNCLSINVLTELTIELRSVDSSPLTHLQYKFDSSEDLLAFVEYFQVSSKNFRKYIEGVMISMQLEKPLFSKYNYKNSKLSKKHFWLSSDNNELLWSSNRTTKRPSKLPLVEIQDIIYGPSSRNFFRALKKNGKNEISYASCFSIVTAKKTIDIQANSDKEVRQWLSCLFYLLSKRKVSIPSSFTNNYFPFKRFRLKLTQSARAMGLSFLAYLKLKINKQVYSNILQPSFQNSMMMQSMSRDMSQLPPKPLLKHKRSSTITRKSYLLDETSMVNSSNVNSYQIMTDRPHMRLHPDSINSLVAAQQLTSNSSSSPKSFKVAPFSLGNELKRAADERAKLPLETDSSQGEAPKTFMTKGYNSSREGNSQHTIKARHNLIPPSGPQSFYTNQQSRATKDSQSNIRRKLSGAHNMTYEANNQSMPHAKQPSLSFLNVNEPNYVRNVLNISNISPINNQHSNHINNQSMFEPTQKIDFTYCDISKVEDRSKVYNDSILAKQDTNYNEQESGANLCSNRTNLSNDILEEDDEGISVNNENINTQNLGYRTVCQPAQVQKRNVSSSGEKYEEMQAHQQSVAIRQKPKIAKLNFDRILKERAPNLIESDSKRNQPTSNSRTTDVSSKYERPLSVQRNHEKIIAIAMQPKTFRESDGKPATAAAACNSSARTQRQNSERTSSDSNSQNSQRFRRIKLTLDRSRMDDSYRERSQNLSALNQSNVNSSFIVNQSFAADNLNTTGLNTRKNNNTSVHLNQSVVQQVSKNEASVTNDKSLRSNHSAETKLEEQWTSRFRGEETTPVKRNNGAQAQEAAAYKNSQNSSYRKKKNLMLDTSLINMDAIVAATETTPQKSHNTSCNSNPRPFGTSQKDLNSLKKSPYDEQNSNGTVIRHHDTEDSEKKSISSHSKMWEEMRTLHENIHSLQESNTEKDDLIRRLRNEKEIADRDRTSITNELNTVAHSLNVLRDYSNTLKDQNLEHRSRNETLQSKIESLEQQLSRAYIREKSLCETEKLDELNEVIKKLTQENTLIQDKLEDERVSNRANEKEKKFYFNKFQQLEKTKGKNQLAILQMQKELQELRSSCETTQKESVEQFQSVKEIVPDLFNIFKYQTDRIYALEAKVASLTTQNTVYERQMKQRYATE